MRLVMLLLGLAACRDAGSVAPATPPDAAAAFTLQLSPSIAELSAFAPGNTVALKTTVFDQRSRPLSSNGVTYSSSAPEIASVDNGGLVTAVAPGIARISAGLTLGGVTQTASMTVAVHSYDYTDVVGVYDVSAAITSFDPAWGEDLNGYRYTAIMTLRDPATLVGTYADLRITGPAGDILEITDSGAVTSFVDFRGRLVVELVGSENRIGLTLVVAALAPGHIDGIFGCCGHIGGTFTAERRPDGP